MTDIGGLYPKALKKLQALADGQWHSIPSLVAEAGLSPTSGGSFGTAYSRLQRAGLAEVRYDESGYWAVAEYRITDAGRRALSARSP